MSLLTELEPVAGWFSINMPRLTVLQTGPLASAVIYDKIHAMNWFEKAKDNLKKWKQQGAEPEIFYSNFTPRAIQVFALARKEAERLNHNFVGTEHVLLGLIKLGQGVAVSVLQKLGIDYETARKKVEQIVGRGPEQKWVGNIPYTPRVKKVLALATEEAKKLNHTYVGTEHLLLGLLAEGHGVAARVLKDFKVDLAALRHEILRELSPNFIPPQEGETGKG